MRPKTVHFLFCIAYTFTLLGCRSEKINITQIDELVLTAGSNGTHEYQPSLTPSKVAPSSKPIATSTFSPRPTSTGYPIIATFPKCPPFDTQLPIPDIPENYIGHHYDGHRLPDGLTRMEGHLLVWREQDDLAMNTILRNDKQIMIWLNRLICSDPIDLYWEIIDVIAIPPLNEDESFGDVCFKGGIETDISAIGTYNANNPLITIDDKTGWRMTNLRFAWHLNRNELKFMEDSTIGLICIKFPGR